MPHCARHGLTTSLLVSDLGSTLSKNVVLTMGRTHQADHKQINDILMNGRTLSEQEISATSLSAPGSTEDMPLLTYITPAADVLPPSSYHASASFYSQEEDVFSSGTRSGDKPQAISLLLQTTDDTFSIKNTGRCNGKDVSYEIYLNGELVQADMINCRSLARTGYTVLQSGTRVHRQVEKPWMYEASHARLNCKQSSKRLEAIGAELEKRAAEKSSSCSQQPMSALFLRKLAKQPLPSLVRQNGKTYSVLDVIVVAGRGNKLGPDTPYLKVPTCSSDRHAQPVQQSMKDEASSGNDQGVLLSASPATKLAAQLTCKLDLSFATGDASDVRAGLMPQCEVSAHDQIVFAAPWAHTTQNFYENLELGLLNHTASIDTVLNQMGSWAEHNPQEHQWPRFEMQTPSWHTMASHMTLNEVIDMTATGLATPVELQGQPDLLSLGTAPLNSAVNTSLKRRRASSSPTPVKHLAERSPHVRSPPALRHLKARKRSLASPMQLSTRTDMAHMDADKGATRQQVPEYGLVTPKTKSNSIEADNDVKVLDSHYYATPAPSDIESSTVGLSSPQTPRKSAPQTPRQKDLALATPVRPGSHRTSKKWDPHEMSIDETLTSFHAPDLTRVGAIQYAHREAKRQIPKTRGTQFDEEVFLCGFRYFVE